MSNGYLSCKFYLAIFLFCWTGSVCLADTFLLPSNTSVAYTEFARHISVQLKASGLPVHVLEPNADLELINSQSEDSDLLVTIGTSALFHTLNYQTKASILAVLITQSAFSEYLNRSDSAGRALEVGQLSALYLEQPASRYLCLATALKPDSRHIGTVTGTLASHSVKQLAEMASKDGRDIRHLQISEKDNPTAAIQQVMQMSDIYLALPDSVLFNRGTAKWVLLTGLKWSVPIIGFSERYAKAGAVAAIYTTPQDAAEETARWVMELYASDDRRLKPPHYPETYTLSLNKKVAEQLGLILPDVDTLRKQISDMEKRWQ